MVIREREIKAAKRELAGVLKPNESITDALAKAEEEIARLECRVEDLEDQLDDARGELTENCESRDALLKLKAIEGAVHIPAKSKPRPEKKPLEAFW